MQVVKQSATLLWITPDAACVIERAARTCYKSEECVAEGSAKKLILMLKERGHLAMLEHASASLLFVTDRGVSHEIVRHRLASYAQESTRYCNYGKDKFGGEITVIAPPGLQGLYYDVWLSTMCQAECAYLALLHDYSPQIARSVLPTCLKTELVMTANFREWLHFFSLRCSPKAHPQMQELAGMARDILRGECPEVFVE